MTFPEVAAWADVAVVTAEIVEVVETVVEDVAVVVAPGRCPKNPVEPPAYGLDTWFVVDLNVT